MRLRNMKVLLDTNILVDFLAKRPVFFNNAQTIIKKCKDNEITGIVAVHTISTFIFSRSNSAAENKRRVCLLQTR